MIRLLLKPPAPAANGTWTYPLTVNKNTLLLDADSRLRPVFVLTIFLNNLLQGGKLILMRNKNIQLGTDF